MDKENTFEKEIAIEHLSRLNEWRWRTKIRELRGEYIYTDFCVWCNCQGKPELRNDQRVFAKWLKDTKTVLTEYQRQCIATKYYGWEFTWNIEEKKWEGKKSGN